MKVCNRDQCSLSQSPEFSGKAAWTGPGGAVPVTAVAGAVAGAVGESWGTLGGLGKSGQLPEERK